MSSSSPKNCAGNGVVGVTTVSVSGAAHKQAEKVTLGYWAIRGLANPIRYLLVYTETPFDDLWYQQGDKSTNFSGAAWTDVKPTLTKHDFPNLPYLIDGDLHLTQSAAMLRHIARKNNMCGETLAEMAKCDMLYDEIQDFRSTITPMCYNENFIALRKKWVAESLHPWLQKFEKYLQGKEWFAGSKKPTYCDFTAYEIFDQTRKLAPPKTFDPYPNLSAFFARFESIPTIKQYQESDKCIHHYINNTHAGYSSTFSPLE